MTEVLKVMSYILIAWILLPVIYFSAAVLWDYFRRKKIAKNGNWKVKEIWNKREKGENIFVSPLFFEKKLYNVKAL